MNDKKDKFLIARVPKALADQVREKARSRGLKISEWIRELVEKSLKK